MASNDQQSSSSKTFEAYLSSLDIDFLHAIGSKNAESSAALTVADKIDYEIKKIDEIKPEERSTKQNNIHRVLERIKTQFGDRAKLRTDSKAFMLAGRIIRSCFADLNPEAEINMKFIYPPSRHSKERCLNEKFRKDWKSKPDQKK